MYIASEDVSRIFSGFVSLPLDFDMHVSRGPVCREDMVGAYAPFFPHNALGLLMLHQMRVGRKPGCMPGVSGIQVLGREFERGAVAVRRGPWYPVNEVIPCA